MASMTFDQAAQKMRETSGVKESDMEILYGLYKQATEGDVTKGKVAIETTLHLSLTLQKDQALCIQQRDENGTPGIPEKG